jgi:hypothetical protein
MSRRSRSRFVTMEVAVPAARRASLTVNVVLTVKDGVLKKKLSSGDPNVDYKMNPVPSVRWTGVKVKPSSGDATKDSTRLEYTFKNVSSMTGPVAYVVVIVDGSTDHCYTDWGQINAPLKLDLKDFAGPVAFIPREFWPSSAPSDLKKK